MFYYIVKSILEHENFYIVKSVLENENFQDVAGNVAYGYQNENSARHEVSFLDFICSKLARMKMIPIGMATRTKELQTYCCYFQHARICN